MGIEDKTADTEIDGPFAPYPYPEALGIKILLLIAFVHGAVYAVGLLVQWVNGQLHAMGESPLEPDLVGLSASLAAILDALVLTFLMVRGVRAGARRRYESSDPARPHVVAVNMQDLTAVFTLVFIASIFHMTYGKLDVALKLVAGWLIVSISSCIYIRFANATHPPGWEEELDWGDERDYWGLVP